MKRFIVFCWVLMLLCTNLLSASCAEDGVNNCAHFQLSEQKEEYSTNSSNCDHPNLTRITPIETRWEKLSETTHVKEEYFTARCDKCLKYKKEIIFSQVVEQHTMQLVDSQCNSQTHRHTYVYRCEGYCEFEDKVVVSCPGIHEEILGPTQILISEEEK